MTGSYVKGLFGHRVTESPLLLYSCVTPVTERVRKFTVSVIGGSQNDRLSLKKVSCGHTL